MSLQQLRIRDYTLRVVELLHYGLFYRAALKVWPTKFIPNEQTRALFDALTSESRLLVPGHGSAGKTFACLSYAVLRYYMEPDLTAVTVTSATKTSMESRAWADLKLLIANSAIPMDFVIMEGRMTVRMDGLDIRDDKHTIECVAAQNKDSQAKVQGRHAEKNILIIDEADNKHSQSIWTAESNLATSGEFQSIALANPFDRTSVFGRECVPELGWESVDMDSSFKWRSKSNRTVLRLDGLRSPNFILGVDKFPFLLKIANVEDIRKNKGESSADWFAYVRGWFPPQGALDSVWSQAVIDATLQRVVRFIGSTRRLAAFDPAFNDSGGDKAVLCFGKLGRLASNPRHPALQVDSWHYIKLRDPARPKSHDVGEQVHALCIREGVEPGHYIQDYTGNAVGVGDYLKAAWSNKIHLVEFGGSPTPGKILAEDSLQNEDRFDRLVTELCFGSMLWAAGGFLGISNAPADLEMQLAARLSSLIKHKGREKKSVESKRDMKKRGFNSPDESDALSLIVLLARKLSRPVSISNSTVTSMVYDERGRLVPNSPTTSTAPSLLDANLERAILQRRRDSMRDSKRRDALKSDPAENIWSDVD